MGKKLPQANKVEPKGIVDPGRFQLQISGPGGPGLSNFNSGVSGGSPNTLSSFENYSVGSQMPFGPLPSVNQTPPSYEESQAAPPQKQISPLYMLFNAMRNRSN